MEPAGGTFRLFRFAGIEVLLHWSWFVVALIQASYNKLFDDLFWHALAYLSLFAIVLLHEFGHAFACRSVGGRADRIVLWPLGGVAFVQPPARPGALLWSIAAGPLVNLALVPVTLLLVMGLVDGGQAALWSDFDRYIVMLTAINAVLLVFNLLPIYPLDGGQILHAILWFFIGRARGLEVASGIGVVSAGGGLVLAFVVGDWWLALIALFVGFQAYLGWSQARAARGR